MPEQLTSSEINSKTDPSVAKQYDNQTPLSQQFTDLYNIIDNTKVCMLTTHRSGVGPVGRSMGVAKRDGPNFLFLANKHSHKFEDLSHSKEVQITFQNTKSNDWASISGKATTTANDDPRIKDLYTSFISAWFGDLGDGVHTGKADDPRMALIEVKPNYIVYWKSEVGALGFVKEIAQATVTGSVAQTGVLRELKEHDILKEGK